MMFIFLENAFLSQKIEFDKTPVKTLPQVLYITLQNKGNLSFLPGNGFKKIHFPRQHKGRGGGNYNLLYQISVRKFEDDLEQ